MTAAKQAIYAGSFDPWSLGHQYILDSALKIFNRIHVLVAVNPAKQGSLSVETRARIIAHSLRPFCNWWNRNPPFHLGEHIIVATTTGLVVDYARQKNVQILLRGLRSTTDFEAEFSLYFSNRSIHPGIQTWALMCPPELIHCSSTYVRTVVGTKNIGFVGTTFFAQALMLSSSPLVGELFDLVMYCSRYRFENEKSDLKSTDLRAQLQLFYSVFVDFLTNNEVHENNLRKKFYRWVRNNHGTIERQIAQKKYPLEAVSMLWAYLIFYATESQKTQKLKNALLDKIMKLARPLGNAEIPLFDILQVEEKLIALMRSE